MPSWISAKHNIYTLQLPTWLNNAGMSKGIYHDKQTLGVILEPGTTIRIKHSDPSNELTLQLELLNDDGSKEKYLAFGNEPAEVTIAHKSVAFISTPYSANPSSIEIDVEYSLTPSNLPIHRTDTDTANFFKLWDDEASAFALINTIHADILVPAKDKAHLKRLYENNGMAHLESYYDSIFELFNLLAGLSPSPDTPTNKNIPNRYFMKANRTGSGAAYYGHTHTAETNDSVATFWLDPCPQNWGAIHEIAHGYQGHFMSYSEIPLGEVWNNLYAYFYQAQYLGDNLFKEGWLYHGDQELLFDSCEQLFESNPSTSNWHLHELLYYLVLIFNKAGLPALADFNKSYRTLCNKSNFRPEAQSFMELIIESCARSSNIDISPLLRIGHISTSRTSSLFNRYQNRKPVYPLYKLVPKEKTADIVKKLNLDSRLDLVDSFDLKESKLMGSIELVLDEKLFNALEKQDFLLRTGSNLTTIININARKIIVNDLAAGVYKLQAPSTNNGKLYVTTEHIDVIADTTNTIAIDYQYRPGVSLASQTINLNGLYGKFASIEIDSAIDNIKIDIIPTPPHIYYAGQPYASITIADRHQRIIYQQELMGDSVIQRKDSLPAAPAYSIRIFHAESVRNTITPVSESVLDLDKTNFTLTTTYHGLYNEELDTPTDQNLIRQIDNAVEIIKPQQHFLLYRHQPLLDDLYIAIDSFNNIERKKLLEKYKEIYSTHLNTTPRIVTASNFSWHQGALSGNIVNIEFDTIKETVHIEVHSARPHAYFDSIYLAIWVYNENSNIIFCQEMRGNIVTEHTLITLPFPEGSEINIFHAESVRAPIINQTTKEQYPVEQRHRVYALGNSSLAI
ncbi:MULTISPECIES: putative mucin/carbohydrate-binding domain-containing protein [unclassified Pseudomonas]|uniref:putative mucin/carbohydrate-binding domain-containing protein n=1 Tax=unclassified Pseudomonas TaxID=196821 RepID=UPI001482A357|nr:MULTISPECIES: putative mucin/carbohydrate-binding domain-containing protein [unclassified Pseudomonas]